MVRVPHRTPSPAVCPVLCICGCACDIVRPGWCGGNQPRGSSPKASVAEVWSPGTQLVASTTRLAGMHTQQSMVGKIGAYPSSLPLRPTVNRESHRPLASLCLWARGWHQVGYLGLLGLCAFSRSLIFFSRFPTFSRVFFSFLGVC
mgnify:CR=1 FL=1